MSSLSSFGVYGCIKDKSSDAMVWLGVGAAMLSILPITYIFIAPQNEQLIETENCINVKGILFCLKVGKCLG